ncbi:MAG: M6 family metalloprotease domain-containing protein [Bacteroidales bacterium]|jgi:M6 family metalloprotease-like protein|nr:M6 family metalloprotease domain-containing protein [Bacteroidales bacterium]
MKPIRCLLLSIVLIVSNTFTAGIFAVPANPEPAEVTQPDGTKITIRLKGDERIHWMESLDGYTLMYNNKKEIVFAAKDKKGNLMPGKVVYRGQDLQKYTKSQRKTIEKTPLRLRYSERQINTMKQIRKMVDEAESGDDGAAKSTSMQKATTPTITLVSGEKKVLCILAQFSDKTFTRTAAEFEALMNQVGYTANGNNGSVKDFYRENSYGKMDITVTVVGPVTLPNTSSHYSSVDDDDDRYRDFAKDAANAANSMVDYSQFAVNGSVPSFHIIFAGYGAENAGVSEDDCIWSHKWQFKSTVNLDGVIVGRVYSCSPELRGSSGTNMTYLGVICHELCHTFGAPDYYDIDYDEGTEEYPGTGRWDLMAGGSWNNSGACPAHINMWQKILFGWVTPIELTAASTVANMPNSADSAVAYWVKANENGERYILENRQNTKFDSYVPGHGLLIYHVHQNALGGDCDNTAHPQEVYCVVASSSYQQPTSTVESYGCTGTDYLTYPASTTFPGTSSKTSFTTSTTPKMFSWTASNAVVTGKDLTDITENSTSKTVSFNFMDGGTPPEPPAPCADSITAFPFTWSFEDVQPCYNFNAKLGTEHNPNVVGIKSESDEMNGTQVPVKTGSYAWVFSSYRRSYVNGVSGTTDYNQYMISPYINSGTVNYADTVSVSFYYRYFGSSNGEIFRVGYSTTDNNVTSFSWGSAVTDATALYKPFTAKFPATAKYVAVNYYSEWEYHLAIDDITFDVQTCDPNAPVLLPNKTEISCGSVLVGENVKDTVILDSLNLNGNVAISFSSGRGLSYNILESESGKIKIEVVFAPDTAMAFIDTLHITSGLLNRKVVINGNGYELYTVTLNAGSGTVSTESITQNTGGAVVTLPNALPNMACVIKNGWEFAGWATSSVNETESAPVFVASSYIPAKNIILYAVYRLQSGGGGEEITATLTQTEITSIPKAAYADAEKTYSNIYGTWKFRGYKQGNSDNYWQIKSDDNAYIGIPQLSKNIMKIVCSVSNAGSDNGDYTGDVYFRSTNGGNNLASHNSVNGKTATIDNIPANNKTGYIQSSRACRIRSVTVYGINVTYIYNSNPYCVETDTVPFAASICYGGIYTDSGFNVNTSGLHYRNVNDSVVYELSLTVLAAPLTADIKYDTIESGEIYTYKGTDYTESAVIKDTLYNTLGCDSVYITINLTVNSFNVSDETIAGAISVKIYPNPSNGKFIVAAGTPLNIDVFTLGGVRVASRQVTGTAEFSVRNKGVYMLRATDGSGKTYTEKVVVR